MQFEKITQNERRYVLLNINKSIFKQYVIIQRIVNISNFCQSIIKLSEVYVNFKGDNFFSLHLFIKIVLYQLKIIVVHTYVYA